MSDSEQQHAFWRAPVTLRLLAQMRDNWKSLVGAMIALGGGLQLLAVAGLISGSGVACFLGWFLILYGSIVALSRLPSRVLGASIDQRLEAWVASRGAGFYGLMTMARFVQLELIDIAGDLANFELKLGYIGRHALEWMIGFSIDSVMNSIAAAMWPLKIMEAYGLVTAGVVAASTWALFSLGSRAFPEVHARLAAESEKQKKKKKKKKDQQDCEQAQTVSPPPPPSGS